MSVGADLNRFSNNPVNVDISRSAFNMNHSVKFSFNVGDLIPFYLEEVLPGDTFSIDTSKVVRTQPLVAPIMDDIFLDTYYFFVPNRLVWEHWKNFMGENTSAPWYPTVEYSVPKITPPTGGWNVGTIADYLGVPPKIKGDDVNALPFRAYALICDQWFRDENLQTPVNVPLDDTTITGVNTGDQVTDIVKGGLPFKANKLHDYFTSCLPGAQKGNAVNIAGIAGYAPVNSYSSLPGLSRWAYHHEPGEVRADGNGTLSWLYISDSTNKYGKLASNKWLGVEGDTGPGLEGNDMTFKTPGTTDDFTTKSTFELVPNNLWADLSSTVSISVNELRQAFAVQKYLEKLARGGSRYIEQIKALFGVTSPDARQQRAEYLGGNRMPLNISQVEQTSATQSGITPQGNVVGMSHTGDIHSDFTKSFTEHGYIVGVCVARYHHTYQQGLPRTFSRSTVFDYYSPVFANIGEQAVKNKEIYYSSNSVQNNEVFGYQEAWADYRFKNSRVAGEMRSVHSTPLHFWHLADNYGSKPSLSDSWIRENKSNFDRTLAVTSSVSNQLIADFYIQATAVRPMPLYSIPGLIDHH